MELFLFICLVAAIAGGYLIFKSTEDASEILLKNKEQEPVPAPAKKAQVKKAVKKPVAAAKPATRGRKPKK